MRAVKVGVILFFVVGYFVSAIFGDFYHTIKECTVAGINDYGYYFVFDKHDKWIYAYYVWMDILLLLLFFTISRTLQKPIERSLFVVCTIEQLLRLIFQFFQIFGTVAEDINKIAKNLAFQMIIIAAFMVVYLIKSNQATSVNKD